MSVSLNNLLSTSDALKHFCEKVYDTLDPKIKVKSSLRQSVYQIRQGRDTREKTARKLLEKFGYREIITGYWQAPSPGVDVILAAMEGAAIKYRQEDGAFYLDRDRIAFIYQELTQTWDMQCYEQHVLTLLRAEDVARIIEMHIP